MPLQIHWQIPVKSRWESDNPFEHATEKMKFRWEMPLNIPWKMPLEIHDDFRGVDFWCAIFRSSKIVIIVK